MSNPGEFSAAYKDPLAFDGKYVWDPEHPKFRAFVQQLGRLGMPPQDPDKRWFVKIGGRFCSGKSAFAVAVATYFGGQVVPGDNFLRRDAYNRVWNLDNYDFDGYHGVFETLQSGQEATYDTYDWRTGLKIGEETVQPRGLIVGEVVGAHMIGYRQPDNAEDVLVYVLVTRGQSQEWALQRMGSSPRDLAAIPNWRDNDDQIAETHDELGYVLGHPRGIVLDLASV